MSDRPRLLVTRRMPDAVTARAARDYDAVFNPEDVIMPPETLLRAAEGKDAMLICSSEKITAELAAALPDSVRIISTFSVGHEHIDVEAVKAGGRTVTNTPEVLNEAVADLAILLLLGAARRGHEGQSLVREGRWNRWHTTMLLGKDLGSARLGILGMGGIGRAIARRARGFGLEIHYHNRRPLPADLEEGAVYHDSPEALAAVSDFLSVNCPSTAETRGLVDAALIDAMPKDAVLVNTARGDIVDDDAVIAALTSGRLFAAGLDVFAGEPDLDPRYRGLTNAFLLPHLGSATFGTRDAMGFCCLDNLDAFFTGKPCPTAL
ncbi:MAG: D-glycerate dehydrogenase [Rhizobiales bacterium NRL2]|nr:MAG: D-glycerate dehydrogenase [Rhizobiales bacterium NRL2]